MRKFQRSNLLTTVACLSAAVLLTGCFETKEEFTINPDGSGKVVHESSFQNMNLNLGGDEDEDADAALKKAIASVIEGAKGVEAWRDVSYKKLDDGRLYFKGTAYFKDLSKLDIPNQTMLEFDWKASPGGGVLTLRTNKGGGSPEGIKVQKKDVDWSSLTPEERTKKLKEERAKFQQMKPMMAGIMGTMKHEVTFHLPGKIEESSNFAKDPSGALTLNFEGAKLLEAMDKLINDDAWAGQHINDVGPSQQPPLGDEAMNEAMFGSKAPVRAVVTANKPLFNYPTEVAEAKKEFAKIKKQLDVTPATVAIAPPATSGKLKSLKVVGVRLITESDKKREIRPFNYDKGYTLALLAEFPGSVLDVTSDSGLDTAIADDGSDLLPKSNRGYHFSFPSLSADKAAAVLEARLELPGPGVKGIKELSGHLQYHVASKTKDVGLGFTELKKGAKGTELGAEIQTIEEGWRKDGSQRMRLKLNIGREVLKGVCLVEGDTRTELHQNGYGGWGNNWTFTYESKTAFPLNGKLVAEVYEDMQTFDAQFKLENLSLLGEPLSPSK